MTRGDTALDASPATTAAHADAEFLVALGARVRRAREQRGLSRKALSKSADVSERYLAQLEAGEGNASIVLLRHVAAALGTPLVALIEPAESSLEERLIRRFLAGLPPHRVEDVILRMMREFGPREALRARRVALVGLRGAGKSTLGSRYARELGCEFVELDREIEREAGIETSEIFLLYGQAGFRRVERRCLERLLERSDDLVISVGGGLVSEQDTYNLLLVNCLTVWIKASPEEHMSRVMAQGDLRPMSGHVQAMDDLRAILASREPLYAKADAVVDTSDRGIDESVALLRDAVARARVAGLQSI